jgi:molybdopterin-synthase adenylyltransferase
MNKRLDISDGDIFKDRYSRHINLIDSDVFKRIQNSKVLVVGAGGIGSAVLELLARYGFGSIHLYDDAIIDAPDLNRQLLYDESDIGNEKTIVAAEKLKKINSTVKIHSTRELLSLNTKVSHTDLVIGCTDNIESRCIIDELFYKKNIPVIHGGVYQFYGQITSVIPFKTNSYREIFGINNDFTEQEEIKDIFPPVVTISASIMFAEAIKYFSDDFNNMLLNKILMIDLKNNIFETVLVYNNDNL